MNTMKLVWAPIAVGDRLRLMQTTPDYLAGQVFLCVELLPLGAMLSSEPRATEGTGVPAFWSADALAKFRMHCSADTDRLSWLDGQCDVKLEETHILLNGAREVELVDEAGEVLGCGPDLRTAVDDSMGRAV